MVPADRDFDTEALTMIEKQGDVELSGQSLSDYPSGVDKSWNQDDRFRVVHSRITPVSIFLAAHSTVSTVFHR